MKILKENKGITLVALIITIIVLLILAVVTIASVTGDGIISKSREAKSRYEDAQAKENSLLQGYLSQMEEIIGNNTVSGNGGETGGTPLTEPAIVYTQISLEEAQQDAMLSRTDNTTTYDVNSKQINIPAGFKILVNDTTGYTSDSISVDQGIVITDGTNEFVWVPVETKVEAYGLGTEGYREPDVITQEWDSNSGNYIDGADNNTTYLNIVNNILGVQYNNSDDFLAALQEDFNLMSESVNKNHGFYVGRYETSLNGSVAQSVKGATSLNAETANTWYGLYGYQKAYSTSSVQGSMIWGSQYDRMMRWMGEAANTTKGDDRNTDRTTGTKETDKINNVYDLYGNSHEWTLEALDSDLRVSRGGSYDSDITPSDRLYRNPTNTISYSGSRLTLYIK